MCQPAYAGWPNTVFHFTEATGTETQSGEHCCPMKVYDQWITNNKDTQKLQLRWKYIERRQCKQTDLKPYAPDYQSMNIKTCVSIVTYHQVSWRQFLCINQPNHWQEIGLKMWRRQQFRKVDNLKVRLAAVFGSSVPNEFQKQKKKILSKVLLLQLSRPFPFKIVLSYLLKQSFWSNACTSCIYLLIFTFSDLHFSIKGSSVLLQY